MQLGDGVFGVNYDPYVIRYSEDLRGEGLYYPITKSL